MDPIVGTDRILQGTFRDVDGDLADPATVTLRVSRPDGTQTSWTGGDLDHPSTGIYQRTVELDQAGFWRWRWEGETDDVTVVDEGVICVKSSAFVGVGS